jgi:hypothetical protein
MSDIISLIVNETLRSLREARKDKPTFEPNPNLGEGKAGEGN